MGRNGNNNNNNHKTKSTLPFKGGKDNCPGNFSPVTEGYILYQVKYRICRPRSSETAK